MPFTYRDRPKLSDRLRGKSGEEILNEMKCDLDNERRMFFDSPWRGRPNNCGVLRGFPFDDYPSRRHIRTHFEDLASRHPEFADQLKEPPWSEDFVNPSFSANRRTPNSSKSTASEREGDSRSACGGNSQGRSQNLNHFGLRNTVPLGQGANPEEQRRQRSMSAPPDNRASDKPKRFISKCEIPIMQDPEEQIPGPEPPQTKPGNSPNVRLIPIQVEGRDEPIINADIDTSTNFANEKPPFEARLPRDFGSYQKHSPRFGHKERGPTQPQPQAKPQTAEAMPMPMPMPAPPPPPQPPQSDETDSKPPESTKAEPPKDPLSKVELIQKEVDQLRQEVEAFEGKSRTDKQYMILDELLTRKLISLDDINTEGKDDVRQARKDTIRSIQRCISLLESRVPQVDNKGSNDSTDPVPVDSGEVDKVKENSAEAKSEGVSRENGEPAGEEALGTTV